MKKSFLNSEKTILTCMVQADTPERIKYLIDKSIPEGAEAFGMQLCVMKPEYRKPDIYRELFNRPTDFLHTLQTMLKSRMKEKAMISLAMSSLSLPSAVLRYAT